MWCIGSILMRFEWFGHRKTFAEKMFYNMSVWNVNSVIRCVLHAETKCKSLLNVKKKRVTDFLHCCWKTSWIGINLPNSRSFEWLFSQPLSFFSDYFAYFFSLCDLFIIQVEWQFFHLCVLRAVSREHTHTYKMSLPREMCPHRAFEEILNRETNGGS